jgi:hypothetical protein
MITHACNPSTLSGWKPRWTGSPGSWARKVYTRTDTLPSELDPLLAAVTIGRPSIQETRAMVCGSPALRTTRRAITGVVTCWAVETIALLQPSSLPVFLCCQSPFTGMPALGTTSCCEPAQVCNMTCHSFKGCFCRSPNVPRATALDLGIHALLSGHAMGITPWMDLIMASRSEGTCIQAMLCSNRIPPPPRPTLVTSREPNSKMTGSFPVRSNDRSAAVKKCATVGVAAN